MYSIVTGQHRHKTKTPRRAASLLAAILLAGTLIFAVPAANAFKPGDLDSQFGKKGIVLGPTSSRALAVAVTPDGKYIAAGCHGAPNCERTILVRYSASGDLDESFGVNGVARFDFDDTDNALGIETAAAIRIEEKQGGDYSIVTAGEVSGRFALARFNSKGEQEPFPGGPSLVLGPEGSATSMALQNDKWILAGRTSQYGGQGFDLRVARFDRNTGAWDTNFNDGNDNDGSATVDISDPVEQLVSPTIDGADGVATDSTGKIYAVGYSSRDGSWDNRSMVAIRLLPDGALDSSFGTDGIFRGGNGSFSSAVIQEAPQPSGGSEIKLVAAGRADDKLCLVRLNADGTADENFGDNGIALGPVGRAAALIEQGGNLVAAGRNSPSEDDSNINRSGQVEKNVLVTRFTPDGRLDSNFGSEGSVVTDLGDFADEATALAVDSSPAGKSKIVVAGLSGKYSGFTLALARYETSFGEGTVGVALTMSGGKEVLVGDKYVYKMTVSNAGPDAAVALRLEQSLPQLIDPEFVSIRPGQGCSHGGATINCNLGGLEPGQTTTVEVTVVPNVPGVLESAASITTGSTDNDLANNSATLKTLVLPAKGAFTAATPMIVPRRHHAAVPLTGAACRGSSQPSWCGRVLVVGRGTAELYDPKSNAWTLTAPLNLDHGERYTATLLSDGKVLVVGTSLLSDHLPQSEAHPGPTSLAEIYDPSLQTWSVVPGPVTPRNGHVAVGMPDGKVLVAGGTGDNTVSCGTSESEFAGANLRSAEVFDINASGVPRWTEIREMTEWRSSTDAGNATATLLPNGDVLVLGGDKGKPWHKGPSSSDAPCPEQPLAGAEIHGQRSGSWAQAIGFEPERHGHTATLLNNGQVLIAGGNTTVGHKITTPSARLYQPNGVWGTTEEVMIFGRSEHGAALLPNGKVLITGGVSHEQRDLNYAPKTAELYNPEARGNSSFESAGITTWRANHTVTTIGPGPLSACGTNCGKILIAGGLEAPEWSGDARVSASAELYTSPPSITQVQPPEGPITGNTEIVISGFALASTSKVTFEGESPLICGPKGQAKCWVDDELPDRKLHVITPPRVVPEQVDLVVETLPGMLAAAHFRYTGVEVPSGPAPPVPSDAGTLPGQQQTTQLPAPPSGTATSVQSSNPSAAQSPIGAPGAVPPGAVAPSTVVAQSPQSIPQTAQSVQAAAGGQLALQPQFGLSPGLAPAPDEEPRAAPRFMFSRSQEPYLVLGWAASLVLGALALCVFGMGASRSAGNRPAAGRARAGPGGCRRIAI